MRQFVFIASGLLGLVGAVYAVWLLTSGYTLAYPVLFVLAIAVNFALCFATRPRPKWQQRLAPDKNTLYPDVLTTSTAEEAEEDNSW